MRYVLRQCVIDAFEYTSGDDVPVWFEDMLRSGQASRCLGRVYLRREQGEPVVFGDKDVLLLLEDGSVEALSPGVFANLFAPAVPVAPGLAFETSRGLPAPGFQGVPPLS